MKSLVSFFALLCGGFALFGAEDKLSDHILFHLDFESQLKARIAKGNPEGVFNALDMSAFVAVGGEHARADQRMTGIQTASHGCAGI